MTVLLRPRGFGENAMWNAAGAISNVALMLVTVPVYLRTLGLEQFGIVAVIATVTGPMSIFNGGVVQGSIREIARLIGEGKTQDVPGVLAATWLLNCAVGVVGVIICLLAGPWIVKIFDVSVDLGTNAEWALRVAGLTWLVGQMSATFRCGLEGTRDQLSVLKGDILFQVVSSILCVAAAIAFQSVVAYSLAQLSAQLCILWFWRWSWLKRFPQTNFSLRHSKTNIRPLWHFSKWQVGTGVVSLVANYGDRYLIGVLLSATTLGLYNIGLRLQATARLCITVFARALFPAISAASHDRAHAEDMFMRAATSVGLFACLPIGMAAVVAPFILRIWLGGSAAITLGVTAQILLVHLLFECPSSLIDSFFNGIGRPQLVTFSSILLLVLTVLLMVPAGWWGGMSGVVWGAAAAYAVAKYAVLWRASRRVFSPSLDRHRLFRSIYGAPLSAGVAVVFTMLLNVFLSPDISLPGMAGLGIASYLVIACVLSLAVPECREAIRETVQHIKRYKFQMS